MSIPIIPTQGLIKVMQDYNPVLTDRLIREASKLFEILNNLPEEDIELNINRMSNTIEPDIWKNKSIEIRQLRIQIIRELLLHWTLLKPLYSIPTIQQNE